MKEELFKEVNYYNEIKNELINNAINRRIKNYGEGIIKEYSRKLTNDLGKGYTETNLKYFRQFYLFAKSHTLCDELSWSHYSILLSLSNTNEIEYYILICRQYNLSVRKLQEKIKSKEYERLSNNIKNMINNENDSNIVDFVKNPIKIRNNKGYEMFSEKILQKLILEDIENFLEELGNGFTFIKSEYPIKIGSRYNYIDLLLYNIKYKCYVVVELKVTELKKEHTGQIMIYMNYIDKNIKTFDENKTVGIIVCKKDNKYVIEFCSDKRIISTEYELVRI